MDLIFEGAGQYDSKELAREFDQLAIQTETDVFLESVRLVVSTLDPHLERAVELIAEVILDAHFDEVELEKLKTRWASLLVAERAQPAFLAAERTMQALFPGHPYSHISFPLAHLRAMKRSQVREVFKSRVVPQQTILLFSGPITIDKASKLAEKFLGNWKPTETPPTEPPLKNPPDNRVYLVHRPGSVQTHFEVARRGPERGAPDFLLLNLTNQIFGGGASSRLFLNLREDKGYTYGAYSLVCGYRQGGFFSAAADVRSDVITDAIHQTTLEMDRIQSQEVTQSEIELARNEMVGKLIRRMETVGGTASLELERQLNDLPIGYYQKYIPSLHQMESQQILECARVHFDTSKIVITVVGDAESILKGLEQFGEVLLYDDQGALLEGL
jgi:predicted Zn-dependent peptidase